MANVDRIGCLANNFSAVSDFLVVYIEEAHPADGWSFKDNYHIKSHRSADERIAAASILRSRVRGLEVVADAMTDDANRAYGGLFERLYIIQNSTVVYQGERGPSGFKVAEVENWLVNYNLHLSQAQTLVVPIENHVASQSMLTQPRKHSQYLTKQADSERKPLRS